MTTIFLYDRESGNYIGQGVAAINPATGEPLLPDNGTTEPPPAGARVRFDTKTRSWRSGEANTQINLPGEMSEATPAGLNTATPDRLNQTTPDDVTTTTPERPIGKRRRKKR